MSYQDGWIVFDTDMNKILDALDGNGVISGLAVTEQTTPTMGVTVGTGVARANGVNINKVASTNVSITTADPTYPRKDIIVLDENGTLSAVAGTAEAASPSGATGPKTSRPKPPDIPANKTLLAEVWVAAGVTAIYNADITDRHAFPRMLRQRYNPGKLFEGDAESFTGYYEWATDLIISEAPASAANVWKKHKGDIATHVYGTYTCRIKLANPVTHNWLYPAFWEWWWNGNVDSGILPACLDGSYLIDTWVNGSYERTTLTGQDWTVEREQKIVWTSTSVKLYIDGTEEANHTTYVPDHQICPCMESRTRDTGTPTGPPRVWCSEEHFDGRDYHP